MKSFTFSQLSAACRKLPTRSCTRPSLLLTSTLGRTTTEPTAEISKPMAKIAALKGISNSPHHRRRHSSHGTPQHARPLKREHAWQDVSDDDMEVKRSKKHPSTPSKSGRNSDKPRKKPRLSAPAATSHASSSKDLSLQKQRKELPIYTGMCARFMLYRTLFIARAYHRQECYRGYYTPERCNCADR